MPQQFSHRLPSTDTMGHRLPWWRHLHIDLQLLAALVVLSGAGLLVLYSASGAHWPTIQRQASYLGVGLVAMFGIAQLDPATLRRWAILAYASGLVLLLWVLVAGDDAKGATRWVDLKVLRFQPSELMKLATPLLAARILADEPLPLSGAATLKVIAVAVLPAALIVVQPDLGSALLIGASGLFALFLGGLRWRWMGSAALAAAVCAPLAWLGLRDYQRQRILTLFDPEADPLGAGWNIIQSKIAIGSGGLHGKGWLQGTQSHLDFLPEGHTDFIFAVLAEEFGLVGILALFGLYWWLIARGLWISAQAPVLFQRLLAGCITLTFFVYVFVNIGMVCGLLPVVGVPLPLMSQGGTSLVTLLAGFGMLMSIRTHQNPLSNPYAHA